MPQLSGLTVFGVQYAYQELDKEIRKIARQVWSSKRAFKVSATPDDFAQEAWLFFLTWKDRAALDVRKGGMWGFFYTSFANHMRDRAAREFAEFSGSRLRHDDTGYIREMKQRSLGRCGEQLDGEDAGHDRLADDRILSPLEMLELEFETGILQHAEKNTQVLRHLLGDHPHARDFVESDGGKRMRPDRRVEVFEQEMAELREKFGVELDDLAGPGAAEEARDFVHKVRGHREKPYCTQKRMRERAEGVVADVAEQLPDRLKTGSTGRQAEPLPEQEAASQTDATGHTRKHKHYKE